MKLRMIARRSFGFTLIEMAMVLGAAAIVAAGSMTLLNTSMTSTQATSDAALLGQAREALVAFVINNRRLPCPDMDGTGVEGNCIVGDQNGYLPYIALGLAMPTGSATPLIRYAVYRDAKNADLAAPLSTSGSLSGTLLAAGVVTDGRMEMMQALRWVGSQSMSTSHPYITTFGGSCATPAFGVAFAISMDQTQPVGGAGCMVNSTNQQTAWATAYDLLETLNRIAK
ncbi:type II secretion system protein [Burkholderia gladioli]|uniref:type II secretion system protein n=1 Tax=Burkholderia gladioli TaxID=28095 RepID=UPI00163EEDB6|nr:hypothetical protein [Burkholderia gladioli]